ncbi:M48 family metalloprotease [Spirochaeta dissipatitropha]
MPQNMESVSRFSGRKGLSFFLLFLITVGIVISSCASDPLYEQRMSLYREQEVGRSALAKTAGQYGLLRDEEITRYITLLLQSLALYVERQDLTYRAAVLDTDQVNAYALPGGYVLLTKGLLLQLENVNELIGVLAHELGHINLDHPLEYVSIEISRDAVETLAHFLAGGRQIVTATADQINTALEERLFFEGYAQDDEYDADRYALQLLADIGLSAEPYIGLLERLQTAGDKDNLDDLSRTHPSLEDRISRLKSLVVPGLAVIRENEDFEEMRSRLLCCKED